MKYIKILKYFYFLLVPTLFSFAQNSTLVGYGLELYHESSTDPSDNGNEYFYFSDASTMFGYDEEDGEWDMGTFEYTNSPGRIVLKWGEDEYADISLNFSTNNLTFTYHEINEETGNVEQSGNGTGTFNFIPNSSLKPPFSRFFEEDFSSLSNTASNFALNHGETIEGLTISQNQASGIYSFTGTYTSDDDDTDHDRWFEISAKTLLPMNKSWIVEAELFLDQFNVSELNEIDYMHAMLHLEFDSQDFGFFEVGSRFNGYEFSAAANAYYEPSNLDSNFQYESSNAPVSLSSNTSFVYRIINDADDYQLRFEVDTSNDSGFVETQTLMLLEWDDGWVETNGNYGYYQGTHFRDWRSLGDQFVQPGMSFELPHSWSNGHGTELTMHDLQGGEIGFRSFSVQPDLEIIEFDDGEDIPAFYNKLSTEVGQGGNTSRYHLLKGLHDLAQLVESTSSNSLKQFAISLGVDDSIIDFSLADTLLAGTYEFELDRAFETGELALFFQDSFIPQLESIDEHFAQVSDTVIMETVMTGAEEDVTVDATDVKVLRAMVNLLGAFTSLQSAYDWNYNIGDLQDLDMEVTETSLEEVRALHPTLFGVRSVTQLQKAKAFLQSAVNVYKEASSGLRTSGRYATPQNDPDFLFVLDESDFEDETQFIADLNEFYDALSNNYTITDDDEYSGTVISLSAFFNGGLDLPNLLPDSVGDQLSADQLTDPTIGGILPGATYANSLFLQDLREEFYEDELIVGQPVRHDTLDEALTIFDHEIYLNINDDLYDYSYFTSESGALEHFTNYGWFEGRRYYYFPYEKSEIDNNHTHLNQIYVSGGSQTVPYYNFSNEEGPIDLSTYEFGVGEDYRFIAVEGFTPHAFAIGSAPSASSSYVSGGPLEAVGDELTLSIPSDFDSSTGTLVFYCVAHPTTMNGELRVLEKEFEDIIDIPVEQVVSFVDAVKSSTSELADADTVWANKILDVIDEDRFVYEVGLNNMLNLYFDQNGGYLHAAEDYSEERLFIPNSEIAQSIKDLIASELPGSEIIDFESERSVLELPNHSNEVFFAIVENNESEMFEVVINGNGDAVIIVMPFEDYIPWRPVELPENAVAYMEENYVYEDGYAIAYWVDERPTPDGSAMELVAYLEDGREVIFDEDGTFNREFNPWDREEDAKLAFKNSRSAWGSDLAVTNFSEGATTGSDSAYVHIEKLDLGSAEESHQTDDYFRGGNWDDMVYRISIVNSDLSEDTNLSIDDLELANTVLAAGTPLKLTFTYEMGEPRYILVSGAKIKGFKRAWPEWDRPGSFTILAETVDAVSTSDGDLASTFGMVVVMGGERFYNGAIFQANVPVLDLKPSEFIAPYEQVAAFSLGADVSSDVNVSAYLPRDLLEWNFGISEPHRVKAGLMDENGSLLFINGSGADEEGAQFTGGGFTRIIHKGHEPDYQTYPHGGGDEDYKLGDHDSDEGFIDEDENAEEGVIKSRFDFNADGFGDSLLEVRFIANAFPAEVGFGDPYEDPYKDLNKDNMGSISGSVLDESGQPIPEFGLWFFQAPDGLDGPWEPAFFILDTNFSTGAYQAYLPEGDYYVEAWAYDPDTGTPYKPEVSESSLRILDAYSSHTLDFALEQDFVVSHEYGQVSSSLIVSGLGSDDSLDISIELYPVEQNGSRITDYPTGWLWVEPNGEISGEAPSGRYEVVLFSYDNSVRLSGGPIFWDINANQSNEFTALQATKAQLLEVSGVIYDADTNAGIWADIVFVDPSDEHREFWPQWEPVEFEDPDSYVEGSYRVKIPAGTYKIKAMRWDGLYQSEYYTEDGEGTTVFSDADSVVIDSDLTDIDFNLNGAPAAQVQVRIVDANTSSAVDFAWFAFFDAEDEYGPVVYPHVLENEGNYSLKLPGGNYKVMVEAGGYEPKFLTSNADGNYTWDSADWSSAASLSLTEGNTTFLPLAELNAFAQEDHERYAFEWFDEDSNITFGTISGKVVTTKGNAVPKARIVAHTDDYLFWFDHFETKVDGTYELNNLPTGNWIVFAEPPFESEEYLGYQSSLPNWDSPIAVDANTTTDIKLTLQGSNVSGRIMYPKKNEDTGRVSLVGLQHAFLWVFQDENETGEPNYNHIEGEAFVFNEAYGETNEDGFFALSLPEAGKYSMRIELPGNLANLALAPVHFELKNPAKEMRLGNAIRIDWSKAEARATTYKLERKLSSVSLYTTLDDNISGSVKSYVDYTVVPGASYDYKLTAITANGSKAIGDSSYKISKPFIYLAPPSKTISGQIRDDLNATITGAEVVAWRMDGEGWANTFTDTAGSYELSVGPGKWEVTVYRPWDQNVNWSYEKAPKTVTFANTSSKTTKTVNFTVNRMGDGKVVGTIDIPDGITDAASSIWIDVFSPDGVGNWANPESNGSFSIPLKPGQYELSVWLDPDKFEGYGSPEPQFIRIGKTEVSVGTISLREFNSTISGVIATSSGSPLGNAEVWAWSDTGGWTSDVTDTTGAFELKVAPGRWEVGFNPPIPADGSESPYLLESPKRIKVGDGVKTLNFTVRKAASKVEGVVYGPSGAPVADLNAWAYAREAEDGNNSDEFFNVLAEVSLSPRGTFSFPGLPGTYTVGLWIPPGSDYAQPDEQTLTLSDAGVLTDENGTSMDKIEFTLAKVDSYVTGSLIDKDTNQSISGLVGEVYAMRTDGDGWQYAPIETNGTYSMLLPPGNWVVEYYLEYDEQTRNYPRASAQPLEVSVQQGATVEGNFVLSAAGASISGSVVYDSNSSTVSESTLYVWAYREGSASLPEYWDEVETDDNGSFTISVLQGGKYEVGVILSNDLREEGYLEPAIQKFKMSTSTKTGLEFRLAQPAQDNYLSGTVIDGSGNSLAGAFVYSWTYDGRESSVYADSNGDFNMTVPSGVLWKLGAEYSEFDANDDEILYLPENDTEADLRKNEFVTGISIVLTRPEFEVPDGISITFDPSKDFVTTLPDGTEITIPGGAANVSSDVETIRLVVTPTAKGLDKSGTDKPADYAYSMELFDDKGKEIEGNFKKDVVIRIPVDVDSFREKGIDLDTLEGMYYSPTKKAWAKAKTSTFDQESGKLTMTTDHFTVNSLVGQTAQSDLVADANTSSLTGYDNWYQSDWLGSFFDASADKPDWVFHVEEKLGWMWVKTDAAGNYWFNHTTRGWLWTGADYFVESDDTKSHFYSFSLGRWLYFHPTNGFYDYEANGGSYLD